jgi:hypothetical protein
MADLAARRDAQMGRIRTIKPELPQDEGLARCSVEARYLWLMTFTIADDEGRFRASPLFLKQLFPYDESVTGRDLSRLLGELSTNRRLALYTVRGEAFGEVVNWRKHQKIDRPTPSRLPGPSEADSEYDSGGTREPSPSARDLSTTDLGSRIVDRGPRIMDQNSPNGESSVRQANATRGIYENWLQSLPPGTKRELTDARARVIRARLKRYPPEDVMDAARGWVNDPWEERANQNDLTILLRNDQQCEKFRDLWRNGPANAGKVGARLRLIEQQFMEGKA